MADEQKGKIVKFPEQGVPADAPQEPAAEKAPAGAPAKVVYRQVIIAYDGGRDIQIPVNQFSVLELKQILEEILTRIG